MDNVSDKEWAARVDLAAAFRLVDWYGWSDLLATHLSVRVPDESDHFLINPFGLMFDEITASSLVKVNKMGKKVSSSDYEINPAGFVLHGAIHSKVPNVNCVIPRKTVPPVLR